MQLIGDSLKACAYLPRRAHVLKQYFAHGRINYPGAEIKWGRPDGSTIVAIADHIRSLPPWPEKYQKRADLTACISFDDHRHHEPHPDPSRVARISRYDVAFVSQGDYGHLYEQSGCHGAYWLPHDVLMEWLPQRARRAEDLEFDVAMVGRGYPGSRKPHTERSDVLSALKDVGLRCWYGSGLSKEEMLDLYRRSKVVINKTRCGDFNARITEATIAGACLLTDPVRNGFDSMFLDRSSCVVYRSVDEAVELAQWLCREDDQREIIAANGKAVAMRHLTEVATVLRLVRALASHAERP